MLVAMDGRADDYLAVDTGGGEWALRERPERLAASYTLQAVKNP